MYKNYNEMKKNIREYCVKKGCGWFGLTIQERLNLTGLKVEDFRFVDKWIWRYCSDNYFGIPDLKGLMYLYTLKDKFFEFNKILDGRIYD